MVKMDQAFLSPEVLSEITGAPVGRDGWMSQLEPEIWSLGYSCLPDFWVLPYVICPGTEMSKRCLY